MCPTEIERASGSDARNVRSDDKLRAPGSRNSHDVASPTKKFR